MSEPIYNKVEYSNLDWNDNEISKDKKSDKKYIEKKKQELLKMENRRRELELLTVENMYRPIKEISSRKKKFTTTKFLMYLILGNCFIIELYSMWTMFFLGDLGALSSLIGAVIGESIAFAVYCYKSFNETKEEVKAQLERDKFEASILDNNNNGIDDSIESDYFTEDTNNADIRADAE
jgi:hypothetical protein|nr:MAG TPA: hypothetical protein [Caudoviricetes sp.]